MTVGEKIRAARKNQRLTQKQLAEMSNVAEISIRNYENQKRQPTIEQIKKIAVALGTSVDSLLGQTETANPFWTVYLEDKLKQVGFSLGMHEDKELGEFYLWINYPDGTLEVSEDDLRELHDSSNEYMRFKLEELKKRLERDFRSRRGAPK